MEPPAARTHQSRPMRLQAFRHALDGLWVLISTQPNARFHLAVTLLTVAAGFYWRLSAREWVAIVLAIALVWIVEGLNTALEFLVDLVSPEQRQLAGWAKDVAAGAVLLASLAAVVVGLLIFRPHLFPPRPGPAAGGSALHMPAASLG